MGECPSEKKNLSFEGLYKHIYCLPDVSIVGYCRTEGPVMVSRYRICPMKKNYDILSNI